MGSAMIDRKRREKLHEQMLAVYGPREGQKCGSCVHFTAHPLGPTAPGRDQAVCEIASKTTPWVGYYGACGKFSDETDLPDDTLLDIYTEASLEERAPAKEEPGEATEE